MTHYEALISGAVARDESPLSYVRGREVMDVLHDAYLS
jgi:hypothetical protein